MTYICLKVETTQEAADIVALILIEEGSEGVSVLDGFGLKELQLIQKDVYWDYIDDEFALGAANLEVDGRVFVSGFFEKDKDLTAIKNRLKCFKSDAEIPVGTLALTVMPLETSDYENEWKKYYSVMEFEGIAVVPAWLDYNGLLPVLKLNPGKAFGTGTHETTSMCLSLLADAEIEGGLVLDIGCGSGILGLSALKTGANRAVLTDIDPMAIEATAENAAINGLENQVDIRQCDLAQGVSADVVLANLTADILLQLQPKVKGLLKKGGRLVLSGIIEGREPEIEAAFSGFKLIKKLKQGPWFAYMYKN